ncbi:DNA-binding GntR family transcriptional regulator [Herbaspirillum sp. Sphag1AN]|uniref:GntR family transcriptional regulator n=1 Tax=unclassified Herbaspirillum TaxID=2624150 RepID=UPI00161A5012|nr:MULTISPECIES: GntR family transcriptional regulator [unclassified Herbaspirillum]MBB3214100.1 DNA-binding GntR family transcriptional regulator [Herbaspirillum sp. Sphag1AN]MBB3247813.1 DNA-binding GntR family transcriptional regulator [Herbaspirillum sp. Sphag64]
MKQILPLISADKSTRRPIIRLAESVYERLREDIFAFRLMPGDRFAENDVAERLQVSRTPVREALMRLQSEGLVRGYFRNGWEVVPLDLGRFAALYELREMIELHAAKRVAKSIAEKQPRSPACEELLGDVAARWRVATNQRETDGLELAVLDEGFHIALVAAAGNPETDLVYRQVTEHIRIMRRLDFAYGDCIRDTYEEHIAILDALDAGDVAQTEVLLLQHIQDSHTVVEQITIDRLEQVRTELGQQPAAAPGRRKRFG